MAISSLTSPAVTGIGRGLQGLKRNAARIAETTHYPQTIPTRDSIRAMVELHENAQQVATSVQVFKAADKVIGSLLDVKA